jgi:hypothetical protein
MSWFSAVAKEVWGLFVDDGPFAVSILVWLAVGWMLPRAGLPNVLACALFVVGSPPRSSRARSATRSNEGR